MTKYSPYPSSMFKKKANSHHKSDIKQVFSVVIDESQKTMVIITGDELEIGLPVQVQLEIIPTSPLGNTITDYVEEHMYLAAIVSVKARIKPGTPEFIGKEEKHLDNIIEGKDDEFAIKARMQVSQKKTKEANRFLGLEIEDTKLENKGH